MDREAPSLRNVRQSNHSRAVSPGPPSCSTAPRTSQLDDASSPKSPSTKHLGFNLLHAPSTVLVDLVFVHGLGGHARKTWSKTGSDEDFWPQQWLPRDPDFRNARIHSFGYEAGIRKGKETNFDIHHLGQALLSALGSSPHLNGTTSRIIFIGHSLGGLVIKKAYLLAKKDPVWQHISHRTCAMLFLATPHHGSEAAAFLYAALQATLRKRLYIDDLRANSPAIKKINDEFWQYANTLSLWSFYEMQPLRIGPFHKLIVDGQSAVLNYPEERRIPMNAGHRSICKFESVSDPNYLTIRDAIGVAVKGAIAETVSKLGSTRVHEAQQNHRDQLRVIRRFLKFEEDPYDDLIAVEDARLDGTCQWFLKKESFLRWKSDHEDTPMIYWLKGPAGSGKSVLAGSVVGEFEVPARSYFFFKDSHEKQSQLSYCLRSLAFQMASVNPEVRQAIMNIQENDTKLDCDNVRVVWRKIFVSCIFTCSLQNHAWIIDGIDECADISPLFDSMLTRICHTLGIRIFFTSRNDSGLYRAFQGLGRDRVLCDDLTVGDISDDILSYAEQRSRDLHASDEESRLAFAVEIAGKAQGSFLWTVSIFRELSQAYGDTEIRQVLDEVPLEMEGFYCRIFDNMIGTIKNKELMKGLLLWVACTARPLKVQELQQALEIDLGEPFPNLRERIKATCAQLLSIDRAGRVQMVHLTAREFLFRSDLIPEFSINKTEAHTQIAKSCLSYLSGPDFRPAWRGQNVSTVSKPQRIEFSTYACESFSDHLSRACPESDELFGLVVSFLQGNILSWIEHVASVGDASFLFQVSKDLGQYYTKCMARRLPTETKILKSWITDLPRIATEFSQALVISPSAIYTDIGPFCPTESAIYRTGTRGGKISVAGIFKRQWDELTASLTFLEGNATVFASSKSYVAVGLDAGGILLYHAATYQKHETLKHGERLNFLDFQPDSHLLASCGKRTVRVWDVWSGQQLYAFKLTSMPMEMNFNHKVLMVALPEDQIMSWNIDDTRRPLPTIQLRKSPSDDERSILPRSKALVFAKKQGILAVAFSGNGVILWDCFTGSRCGRCDRELLYDQTGTPEVTCIALKPHLSELRIAVGYQDQQLIVFDAASRQEIVRVSTNCKTLAASPDGQYLASWGLEGYIRIYKFDTLTLVHKIWTSITRPKQLVFSSDSRRLLAITSGKCHVWTLPVFLEALEDQGVDHPPWPPGSGIPLSDHAFGNSDRIISCMTTDENEEYIICGKQNGSVSCYDLQFGHLKQTLYHHDHPVEAISWWPGKNLVLSVDVRLNATGRNLEETAGIGWTPANTAFQSSLRTTEASRVHQILPCRSRKKFIVSMTDEAVLCNIEGREERRQVFEGVRIKRFWLQHPTSEPHVISFDIDSARVWAWKDLSEVASYSLDRFEPDFKLQAVFSSQSAQRNAYIMELKAHDPASRRRGLEVINKLPFELQRLPWDDDHNQDDTTVTLEGLQTEEATHRLPVSERYTPQSLNKEMLISLPKELNEHIKCVLGFHGEGDLVYLDQQSWVCSMTIENVHERPLSYFRHFFLPEDWYPSFSHCRAILTKANSLVIPRGAGIIVVKGGLEVSEKILLGEPA